ncbi:hypothetical protein [Candidatus Villigracilis saccharophilus]|uniref:hypothetical protein n=1 Tax=Candidatus Villigracilis saccharophilus TaxID=3140684 RepID=UPI0031365F67|nr:hypothetical protein [Anaerolineales bacterium]
MELDHIAFLPIRKHDTLMAIIMLGSRKRVITSASIQPYGNLADLISITLEKADAIQKTERHLSEMESLASINELISETSDLQSFSSTACQDPSNHWQVQLNRRFVR